MGHLYLIKLNIIGVLVNVLDAIWYFV